MKKKLGLIAAVLMVVAAPVWASVDITCTQVPGTRMVTVSYVVNEPNKVRGFALDITVDSGAKIIDVNESFLNASYNIYPGSIVITGNQITDYGTPVANPYDPCTLPGQTQPGLNSSGITIEMGSLYYPTGDNSPNSPNYPGAAPWTGDLLRFEVDKDCCVTITENTVRGGIVLTNGGSPSVVNSPGCCIVSCPPAPASIDYPATDSDGSYTVSWAASSGATYYELERSSDGGGNWSAPIYTGTALSYNESGLGNGSYRYQVRADGCSDWCTGTWDCVVCIPPAAPAILTVPAADADGVYTISWTASAGATSYQLESSAPASGTTIYPLWVQVYSGTALSYNERVGGGNWSYQVKATNACGSSDWTTVNSCVVSDCLKSTDPNYAAWKTWRYPACWCCFRQCRGDINCKKTGTQHVQLKDLNIFKAAYTKTDAQLAAVVIVDITFAHTDIPGICADLNQQITGTQRVQLKDLTEFKKYYTKTDASVPCCDTAAPAGDCTLTAGDRFNYWMAQN